MKVYPYKDYKKLTGKPLLSKAGLIFFGIGLLVLLTALFNFLLFTAGRMFNRRKELGIRELHGATSGRLLSAVYGRNNPDFAHHRSDSGGHAGTDFDVFLPENGPII